MANTTSTFTGMNEEWKGVVGWPWYEVSSLGRVRHGARILSTGRCESWYATVTLYGPGLRASAMVHRLVMAAFVGPCPPGMQVNHKDGIKRNSTLDNLEYVTVSQNQQHAVDLGLVPSGHRHHWHARPETHARGEQNGNVRLTAAQIVEIRRRLGAGQRGVGVAIAREFGIAKSTVSQIKKGRTWQHVAAP